MPTDKKPLVSVIVPVYNAAAYLAECLESVRAQTYTQWELLTVDDGSEDESPEICRALAQEDERIIYIRRENGGVSAARNAGLRRARGEWIAFLDADDRLRDDMLARAVSRALEVGAELLLFGFEAENEARGTGDFDALTALAGADGLAGREDALKALISQTPGEAVMGYVWRGLYGAKMLKENGVRFAEGRKIAEDFLFLAQAMLASKRIAVLPERLYRYRLNGASVTARYISTLPKDMADVNGWIEEKICGQMPALRVGLADCTANSYLNCAQNICRRGTPFSMTARIRELGRIKRAYGYQAVLCRAWRRRRRFRPKAWMAVVLFRWHLDFIYLMLFSLKQRAGGAVKR